VLKCSLSQSIPRFGKAEFNSFAGGRVTLSFLMRREYPLAGGARAVLLVQPPAWRSNYPVRQLAATQLQPHPKSVVFERDIALRALYELERGMSPTLSFRDLADQRDRMVISLNSVRMKSALETFQACTGQLHPDSFEDVRFRSVWFGPDQIELDPKYRSELDRMLAYAKVDQSVTHIVIKGYADARGTFQYNEELSQMRAKAVRNYLVDRGFRNDNIAMVFFGERYAKFDNKSAKGRAKNRRVDIELQRR
jgi:outer membrane protein OmpA-like peptidoglycan-associated protein